MGIYKTYKFYLTFGKEYLVWQSHVCPHERSGLDLITRRSEQLSQSGASQLVGQL